MQFSEIQDEIINFRFREGLRSSVKQWINMREAHVWSAADWPWKHAGPTSISLTSGVEYVTGSYYRPEVIWDDDGLELLWMEPNAFDREFREAKLRGTTSKPAAYKWYSNHSTDNSRSMIVFGDTPDSDYTFSMKYIRPISINSSAQSPKGIYEGVLTEDTDRPCYPEFAYVLVLGGIATGLKMENDPTWVSIEQEYQEVLTTMKDYYLPSELAGANMQYGRDELGLFD